MSAVMDHKITLQQERYSPGFIEELKPLIERNWKESESYKADLEVNPNYVRYQALDDAGLVVCMTARMNGFLFGYAIFFISFSLHHQHIKGGYGDAAYVEHGIGAGQILRDLVLACHEELKTRGVTHLGWPVPQNGKLHKLLLSLGYVGDEIVMEKVL